VRLDQVDAKAIRDLEPNLAPLYHRGVLFSDAYTIDSPKALAFALAEAIQKRGGIFVRGEATRLAGTPTGASAQVDGNGYHADRMVIACGAWSGKPAQDIGDRVLLDTERGYHVLFPSAGKLLQRPVCYLEHGFYMVPMVDGLRAVGTVELGGLAAPLNPARTQAIRSAVTKLLPGAGQPGAEWLGFRPSMPDSLPVIGTAPSSPRVTHAFGHGHLGLTLAGITGRLVAELISGRPTSLSIDDLRPDRFSRLGWPRSTSKR
jgi:glycine/D-amino acid oxidase-like deaminating enzyme